MNPEADNNLEEWEAKLAEYSLGVMEAVAASEFERQLNECRVHVTLAQQYTQVIGALGHAAPPAEPPTGHRARFMARLVATPQETHTDGATATISTPVAATQEQITSPTEPIPPRVSDLGAYREQKRARLSLSALAAIAAALVLLVGGTAFVTSQLNKPTRPQMAAFRVQGQGPQPSASAFCVVDTKTNEAYLLTNGLQPLSPQQVYELWWLPAKGDPVAAGTFNVDDTGKARHTAPMPESVSAFTGVAVTVESAPGGPKPLGKIVLAGNYSPPK